MGDSRDTLAQLADILADLYIRDADVIRIVNAAGMRPAMIQFDSRPVNTWASVVREASARQRIDELIDLALHDYPEHRGLLAARAGTLTAVRGPDPAWHDPDSTTQEKIIGGNDLLPIWFLARGAELGRAVGRVLLPDGSSGTGFLVARDLVLTNNHVLSSHKVAETATFQLNFQSAANGVDEPIHEVALLPQGGFCTDVERDWSLVRVAEPVGDRWGTIDVRPRAVVAGDAVYIIQHPGGGAKQVALGINRVTHVGDDIVQYLTDTMPGSSGSPVFDQKWQLVALHHSGGWLREPGSKRLMFRNEGIAIGAVYAGLMASGLYAQ